MTFALARTPLGESHDLSPLAAMLAPSAWTWSVTMARFVEVVIPTFFLPLPLHLGVSYGGSPPINTPSPDQKEGRSDDPESKNSDS